MRPAADSADAEFRAARELFFAYDGSLFYMSRDGSDRRYLEYRVPESVEQGWLAELTARHLASLDAKGNWRVINFLLSHRDSRYLDATCTVTPWSVSSNWSMASTLD